MTEREELEQILRDRKKSDVPYRKSMWLIEPCEDEEPEDADDSD